MASAPSPDVVRELDLDRGGRAVHGYDTGPTGRADELVVAWHGGTPNTGEPPGPLLPLSRELGVRWIGADRPGYGGSTPDPTATLATAVHDVAAVADALGVTRFAAVGHSGGGPRALAAAALLPERTIAAVSMSGTAPWGAEGLDWFAGMSAGPARELEAARAGREALEALLAEGEDDPGMFTDGDLEALESDWSWLLTVVRAATAGGTAGFVQDDLASMGPWGFDPATIRVPVRIVHGTADRLVPVSHGAWLAERIPGAVLERVDGAGHVTVLRTAGDALRRLREAH